MVDVSAKTRDFYEITPQTNYVTILSYGRCLWQPRFELAAAHCSVDITWFPFDVQICDLMFESWLLRDDELKINILYSRDVYKYYAESDEWNLTCAFNRAAFGMYSLIHSKIPARPFRQNLVKH